MSLFKSQLRGVHQQQHMPGVGTAWPGAPSYCLVGMGWDGQLATHLTPPCSAPHYVVGCACLLLLRSTISVPTAPHSKETLHQLATEANPPLTVSPVRGASTGTMGLGFRQGVPQTPKVEQHLCPLSDRPTLCSDSRAPRATHSCLLPRTALR